uniref:Chaperone surA n=1 Tax=Lygus hesperus TaxID=30085 RepID=A0A0A9VS36_LYGHE
MFCEHTVAPTHVSKSIFATLISLLYGIVPSFVVANVGGADGGAVNLTLHSSCISWDDPHAVPATTHTWDAFTARNPLLQRMIRRNILLTVATYGGIQITNDDFHSAIVNSQHFLYLVQKLSYNGSAAIAGATTLRSNHRHSYQTSALILLFSVLLSAILALLYLNTRLFSQSKPNAAPSTLTSNTHTDTSSVPPPSTRSVFLIESPIRLRGAQFLNHDKCKSLV